MGPFHECCGQHFQPSDPKGKAAGEEGDIPILMQSKSEQVAHSQSPTARRLAVIKSVAQFQPKMFPCNRYPRSLPVAYRSSYSHPSLLQVELESHTPTRGRYSLASPNTVPVLVIAAINSVSTQKP